MNAVPPVRIRQIKHKPLRPAASYVLYWMIANRRLRYNFALDRAIEYCHAFKKPLLVFESLRCGYQWASDRIHKFVIEGMAENAVLCKRHGIAYYPYVEDRVDAGKGLLEALAAQACVVVTDDFPCFFLPRMVASAAKKLSVALEAVDSNGLLPLHAADHAFSRAVDFRRFLQKNLPAHLDQFPAADPLKYIRQGSRAPVARSIEKRWRPAAARFLVLPSSLLSGLPIDHSVFPTQTRGGSTPAARTLKRFLEKHLKLYGSRSSKPESDATSRLSPYLHFGHVSVHEIFLKLARREKWKPENLAVRNSGSRDGWWNMSSSAERFLDELVTWRELGYNFAAHRTDYNQYRSLPEWARKTLKSHTKDERIRLYTLEQFELAETHDPLWNAAQTQLVREGRIHSYLRMLWGKKILEWSKSPEEAAQIMIHLNNRYGLDGRDPNSYTGIFWVLGRHDRPWAPERSVFGTVRYMSSEGTARKFRVAGYILKFSPSSMRRKLKFWSVEESK